MKFLKHIKEKIKDDIEDLKEEGIDPPTQTTIDRFLEFVTTYFYDDLFSDDKLMWGVFVDARQRISFVIQGLKKDRRIRFFISSKGRSIYVHQSNENYKMRTFRCDENNETFGVYALIIWCLGKEK